MEKKITIGSVLSNGMQLGIKNAASLLGCIILWILTSWIPYINIGTTIGLCCLPLEMAKGNVISPTSIFDKKYFKYMGEFFLTVSFMYTGILMGTIFFVIPGMVISIAWSLAVLFVIDKGVNPMEGLSMSNKATMGYKWTIYLSQFIMGIIISVACVIFLLIPYIGWLFMLIAVIVSIAIVLGMNAYIYSKLSK